jgi:flagellar biosynthesis protein FlhF
MHTHTFTAARLETALDRVKRELGANAVIVSSKRLDPRRVEVRAVAAADASEWREPAAAPPREPRSLVERLLIQGGVDEPLATYLASRAGGAPRTLREATEAVVEALRRSVEFALPDLRGPRRVLAFVGPTGVGKTTTLAKIAARTALVERRPVGLVTLDGYRIGATAQIEAFADLIGVPLEVARDATSFRRSLRRLADAEVVFVDTAGRAPRDDAALSELAAILQSTPDEVETTLCIAAATRRVELEHEIERHAVLAPRTLTVTKADEARQHGGVLSAHLIGALPLAWITTGQRVPEDVEVAAPEKLAAALCGEEVYE